MHKLAQAQYAGYNILGELSSKRKSGDRHDAWWPVSNIGCDLPWLLMRALKHLHQKEKTQCHNHTHS